MKLSRRPSANVFTELSSSRELIPLPARKAVPDLNAKPHRAPTARIATIAVLASGIFFAALGSLLLRGPEDSPPGQANAEPPVPSSSQLQKEAAASAPDSNAVSATQTASSTNVAQAATLAKPDHAGHNHPGVPSPVLLRIAAEDPELAASSSTSSEGLKPEPGPVSGTMLNLQGRFQSVAVATVGPDGKLSFTCVSDIGRDFAAATNNAASKSSR